MFEVAEEPTKVGTPNALRKTLRSLREPGFYRKVRKGERKGRKEEGKVKSKR